MRIQHAPFFTKQRRAKRILQNLRFAIRLAMICVFLSALFYSFGGHERWTRRQQLHPIAMLSEELATYHSEHWDNSLHTLQKVVKVLLLDARCPEDTLLSLLRNSEVQSVHILHTLAGPHTCERNRHLAEFVRSVHTPCPTGDIRCRSVALSEYFGSGQNCSFLKICVACSSMERNTLRALCPETTFSMPYDDFENFIWVQSLDFVELAGWKQLKIDITVVTTCRMYSLQQLLADVQEAYYFGDEIDLHIAVEGGGSNYCVELLNSFVWSHGRKNVHRRIQRSAGPQVAIPEAITFGQADFQVLLEDDVRVSNQYYAWLKFVTLQMRTRVRARRLFSVSLYTPRVVETGETARSRFQFESQYLRHGDVFLFEVPCSWGAAFKKTSWSGMLKYFEMRLNHEITDTDWIKQSKWLAGSWKKWLIELGYIEHWMTLYPYFENETSFSTNTLGVGVHIDKVNAEMRDNYTVPLINDTSWYASLSHKRLFDTSLPRLDYRGVRIAHDKLYDE